MTVLVDSNIVARLAQHTHPMHAVARGAVSALQSGGESLQIVPQVLYEFWVVATRPVAVNGLGLTVAETQTELTRIKTLFPLLPDGPAIYAEWERLVVAHQATGRNAHDARLVAAMVVHRITRLLTFNTGHFARSPGITILDPATVQPPP